MGLQRNSGSVKRRLIEKGVRVICPESVEVGPEVNPERISGERVTINPGCRIFGEKTLMLPGAELGLEAPATIYDCQLGKNVCLKGGFFKDSCFLAGSSVGSGAQVREACLLEEESSCAHTVGLKHTILFPFVVLGSLINFCDCLMAGGTDRKNHSEVGSSYIHFNYTPNQDKATASLIGDVPKGVMINRSPIFLGGQGGLVGPVKVNYGTVIAAGTIVRKDVLKGDTILLGHASYNRSIPFTPGLYTNVRRIIRLNTEYIANVMALRRWYLDARSLFTGADIMERSLFNGAVEKLDLALEERIKRLGEVADRMPGSIEIFMKTAGEGTHRAGLKLKNDFHERWNDIEDSLRKGLAYEGDKEIRDRFLAALEESGRKNGRDYVNSVKGLRVSEAETGTLWLQGIVDDVRNGILGLL